MLNVPESLFDAQNDRTHETNEQLLALLRAEEQLGVLAEIGRAHV
jgi:hypothetical protein